MAVPVNIDKLSPGIANPGLEQNIEFAPGGATTAAVNDPNVTQKGIPSIINPYALLVFPSIGSNYNRFFDNQTGEGDRNFTPKIAYNPSISMLVNDEKLKLKTPYRYTDFLYCKYNRLIPNNQLITLRRYPAPTFDNLEVPGTKTGDGPDSVIKQDEFFPIAQAVTWFGEQTGNKLSDILSFSTTLNWKNVEAEVNAVAGNEQSAGDGPFSGAAKVLGILTGQVNTQKDEQNSQYDPYANGPYSHRVYGPVNVISKTYKRDRGLDFKQSISLNFEYHLQSIGSINPKVAMLDIMSNMLSITYNNAAFWGGANRYFPQKPTFPFIGGPAGMEAWYSGKPAEFASAIGKQMTTASASIGSLLEKLAQDPIEALKGIAAGAAKLGMAAMKKGRAPDILAIRALLTGVPIGEWHLTVGNPYAPIAKIGNLICMESKFQFNDIIGADDFPTEMKVTITLEHGRPRDKGDIESMFNEGNGRIYYPPTNALEPWNRAYSTQNSQNDTSWKTGNNKDDYSHDTKKIGIFSGDSSEIDKIGKIVTKSGRELSQTGKRAWELADKMFLRNAGNTKT